MANQVNLIKIFIASPSDVSQERDQLKVIIDEINLTTNLPLRLD
jgi:hypothetical protein